MKLSQFKFKLPEEQIALYPHSAVREFTNSEGKTETFRVTRSDECRLMVIHRKSQTIDMFRKDADGKPIEGEYLDFRNVLDYFDEHDTFIFNDTKVFPARLYGTKEKTDAKIEVFLLRELNEAGTTIIVITHDNELAASLPRQVAIRDGEIVSDSGRPGGVGGSNDE